MTMITICHPDGTKTVRKMTKADEDHFYASFSKGIDAGGLTVLRHSDPPSPQTSKPPQEPEE